MNGLGKISLILSLMCFLITFAFKLALTGWIPFIGYGFGFGLFFFVFALAINFKYFKVALRSESLHFLVKSGLSLLLVVVLAFILNFILFKKNWTQDITDNKIHSLSNLTQALVKALPEDLYFYYFHVDNAKVQGFERQVRAELQPYLELSSKVHFQSHSVFKKPDLAKKFKIGDEESTLFVEYKGRVQRLSDLKESVITNALLKLTKKPKKIYFLQAHDERKLNDESTFGLKGLKDQLERLHYQTAPLDSLAQIPEDIAMLVMVGSRQPLSEDSLMELKQYIEAGGALLVAADPGEDHKLNRLLKDYGIELQKNFVFSDQAQAGQSELLALTYKGLSKHEVSLSLEEGQNPAFFISSTISILEDVAEDIRVQPLLEHLPSSVGRADIDPTSPVVSEGKQFAAVVSEGLREPYFRIVVVGDSDFLTNQFYSVPANFDFALSLFTFLSKDEDLLKLKPPVPKTTYLVMTQTQMNLYFLFFVIPFSSMFFIISLFFKLRRFF